MKKKKYFKTIISVTLVLSYMVSLLCTIGAIKGSLSEVYFMISFIVFVIVVEVWTRVIGDKINY